MRARRNHFFWDELGGCCRCIAHFLPPFFLNSAHFFWKHRPPRTKKTHAHAHWSCAHTHTHTPHKSTCTHALPGGAPLGARPNQNPSLSCRCCCTLSPFEEQKLPASDRCPAASHLRRPPFCVSLSLVHRCCCLFPPLPATTAHSRHFFPAALHAHAHTHTHTTHTHTHTHTLHLLPGNTRRFFCAHDPLPPPPTALVSCRPPEETPNRTRSNRTCEQSVR